MSRLGLSPQQADLLLMHLVKEDIVPAVNIPLKVRRASLTVDYTTHIPSLSIAMPGVEPQQWMWCDTRKNVTFLRAPSDPQLALITQDIMDRLGKHDAFLKLGTTKNKNHKLIAKLQIFVRGSNKIALTLFDTPKGTKKTDTEFTFGELK